MLAFLGLFFLLATLAGHVLTWLMASEHGWEAFRGTQAWAIRAQEIQHAWLVLFAPAVVATLWLGFGRRMTRTRVLLAAAWMSAWLPVLFVWRDWRVARRRDGWDVPQIFWQRERLWPIAAIALGLLLGVLLLNWWLRRRSQSSEKRASSPTSRPFVSGKLGLLPFLIALCWWAVCAWMAAAEIRPGAHPVMYVTWDSTRADHVSAYGYERQTTPHLDALAAEGVLFERAYSQHNWTRPAYASILSSKPQWGRADRGLDLYHWTLAEELKAAGYATAALIQNPNMSGFFGFAQGFDRFVEYREDSAALVARAQEWLSEFCRDYQAGGPPFFLFVHLNDPHWPYRHEQALASGFTTENDARLDEAAIDALMRRKTRAKPPSDEQLEYLFAAYDAEILAADSGLGVLLDALESSGAAGDTLVAFNSDHGDEFYERQNFGHGHANVFPELTRVPFVLRFPESLKGAGALRGVRYQQPVESIDLFPTLLGALGWEPAGELEGRDLFGRLGDPGSHSQAVFLARSFNNQRLALRSFDYALSYDTAEQRVLELFELEGNLGEMFSTQSGAARPWAVDLRTAAETWKAERERSRASALERAPDADLTEELRRLGYL